MNWSFILKLAWQAISHPNKWWVHCLLKKYGAMDNIWQFNPKARHLILWRNILHTRSWLKLGLYKDIKNGKHTLVYQHNWVLDIDEVISISSTVSFICFAADIIPEELLISDLYNEETQTWDWDKVCDTDINLPAQACQFLQSTVIQQNSHDSWVWKSSNNSIFTVKSGCTMLFNIKYPHSSVPIHVSTNVWCNIFGMLNIYNQEFNCLPGVIYSYW